MTSFQPDVSFSSSDTDKESAFSLASRPFSLMLYSVLDFLSELLAELDGLLQQTVLGHFLAELLLPVGDKLKLLVVALLYSFRLVVELLAPVQLLGSHGRLNALQQISGRLVQGLSPAL